MKKFLLVLSFCVLAIGQVLAQSQTISGTVLNAADDQPVIGASIQIKGTSKGTITDVDGKFSIEADAKAVLVVSFLGMETQEVAAKNGVVINLSEDTKVLDEVMVVGYGTTTRAQFVGSAKAVDGEEFTQQAQANVTNALQGKVAGVQVVNSSGQPGSGASIRIRGTGSINGGTTPLYIVDGAPYEGSINSISSYDIASITVLKDAAATAIYGARGANGVVLITTKSGSSNTKFEVVLVKRGWFSLEHLVSAVLRSAQGLPTPDPKFVMSHSANFKAAYNPHYRIIRRDIFEREFLDVIGITLISQPVH